MARLALALVLRVCSTSSGVGEDQSQIREGIIRMLEPAGFDVGGWAADARDVVRKARAHRAVHRQRYPAAPGWMRSQEVFGLARGAVRRRLRRSLSLAARVRLTSASGTIRSRAPVLLTMPMPRSRSPLGASADECDGGGGSVRAAAIGMSASRRPARAS
jgi:hypothetical protein